MLDIFFTQISPSQLALACLVTLFAGFVKGALGFAMPMIMISAFSNFLPAPVALAGMVLPTLFSNISQALRQGLRPALETAAEYKRYLAVMFVCIFISAQLFWVIPRAAYLLTLGVPITAFAALQLLGLPMRIPLSHYRRAEVTFGAISGLFGGMSGLWGPPLVVFLLSTGVEKLRMMRIQGVVFSFGALTMLIAYGRSELAVPTLFAFSALLIIPAYIGVYSGFRLQDRLNQEEFRRWTQILMVIAGGNLIRQGVAALL